VDRTYVLLASEDMITQRIDAHLARAKRATVSVGKHLKDGRSETPAEKSLPKTEGRKKLCENRRIRVSGPRRKSLRALQRQHLNRPLQTDVRECPLVLGPTTHDVCRKGAL